MAAWVVPVVMGVVSLASSAYSAISGANAAEDAWERAQANATNLMAANYYNNLQATNLTGFSALLSAAATTTSNTLDMATAEYNAQVIMMAAGKDAELLEREAEYVYQEADLNIFQREQQGERLVGQITTAYGASGAQLNVPGDAPMAGIIDAKVQTALDTFIIRHGANIQAGKLLDAAATSEWEGRNMANKMLFEAYGRSAQRTAQAGLNILGSGLQTEMNVSANTFNATVDAMNVATNGGYMSSQISRQGTQGMFNGLFNAGSSFSSAYTSYNAGSSGTT